MNPTMRAMTAVFTLIVTSSPLRARSDAGAASVWTEIAVPPDPAGRELQQRFLYQSVFPSATDGWVFGINTQLRERPFAFDAFALRGDGSTWQEVTFPGSGRPVSASASSPSNVWVGLARACPQDLGPALRFDGSGWTAPPGPGGCPSFVSIKAFAPDDVWAVGSDLDEPFLGGRLAAPLLAHFDGAQWTATPRAQLGDPFQLTALGGVAAGDLWLLGTSTTGDVLALHFDGSTWTRAPARLRTLPHNLFFGEVVALATNDVWAAGALEDSSYFLHWDGTGWSAEVVAGGMVRDLAADGSTLVAVGETRTLEGERPFVLRRVDGVWVEGSPPPFARGHGRLEGVTALPGGGGFLVAGRQLGEDDPVLPFFTTEVPFLARYQPTSEEKPDAGAVPPPAAPAPAPAAAPRQVDLGPTRAGGWACDLASTRGAAPAPWAAFLLLALGGCLALRRRR